MQWTEVQMGCRNQHALHLLVGYGIRGCMHLLPTIITPDVIDEICRILTKSADHLDAFFAQRIKNRLVPMGKIGDNGSVNSKTLECNSRVGGDSAELMKAFSPPDYSINRDGADHRHRWLSHVHTFQSERLSAITRAAYQSDIGRLNG